MIDDKVWRMEVLYILLIYSTLVLITFIIQYNWIEAPVWILFLAIRYNLPLPSLDEEKYDKFSHALKLYEHESMKVENNNNNKSK